MRVILAGNLIIDVVDVISEHIVISIIHKPPDAQSITPVYEKHTHPVQIAVAISILVTNNRINQPIGMPVSNPEITVLIRFISIGKIIILIQYPDKDRSVALVVSGVGINKPYLIGFSIVVGIHIMTFTWGITLHLIHHHRIEYHRITEDSLKSLLFFCLKGILCIDYPG